MTFYLYLVELRWVEQVFQRTWDLLRPKWMPLHLHRQKRGMWLDAR